MKYPVVYSYRTSRTRELELSLESLKNLKEWNGMVFIVGHEPKVDFDYAHLPITHGWGRKTGYKSNDEVCAYLTAADMLGDFIIMADDQFILKPWSLEYQDRGTLTEHIESRRHDSYTRQLQATRDFLSLKHKPQLSYEMHIPFLVNSKKLKKMAELIQDYNKPMLIRSLLGNWYKIPSVKSTDPKNQTITEETVLYSSDDTTFRYEKVKEHLK